MNKLFAFILLSTLFIACQKKSFDYKILQYEGIDSLNTKVVKEVMFNEDSLIILEKYRGFKTDDWNSTSDVNIIKIYNNKLLAKTFRHYPQSTNSINGICCDSSRAEFHYNEKNQLIKRVSLDYKYKLKQELEFNKKINSDDIERKWLLSSETFFSYDSLGRKIEYNAPQKHWSSQNRFIWSYDEKDRVLEEQSFDKDRLIWTKKYNYKDDSYKYVLTWYDYEGNPKHLKEKPGEYSPQKIYEFKLNKVGQEIEVLFTTDKGIFVNKKITEYDDQNRISKTIMYSEPNEPNMTHIYIYE